MKIRICGIEVPADKRVEVALTYIYGIGRTRARKTLTALNMNYDMRLKDVNEEERSKLTAFLQTNFVLEGDLRREKTAFVKRLCAIRCYRGIRRLKKLPVRGQKTKSNARTCKGPRRSVSSKKK